VRIVEATEEVEVSDTSVAVVVQPRPRWLQHQPRFSSDHRDPNCTDSSLSQSNLGVVVVVAEAHAIP
jgi:hypothetical protein